MANRQIYQLDSASLDTTDVIAKQDASGTAEAKKVTIQSVLDTQAAADQNITGVKAYNPEKLQVFNTANGVEALVSYDEAADETTHFIIPKGVDDGGGNYYGTVQYTENLSNDMAADTGSTTKYQSVNEVENYVAKPYKVYSALLNQSGTSAPTATVLQNQLSGSIVWTRTLSGRYIGTLSGAFTNNKTLVFTNQPIGARLLSISRASDNTISINCADYDGNYQDDFANFSIEIRVYN